jgi:hypothetical protein
MAPIGSCAIGCRLGGVLCDDAVLQAFVQFGAAVNGNSRPAGGVDGCNQVNCGLFHQVDFSKDALIGW